MHSSLSRGSYKYEFDRHARRARGVPRPRARRSGSKPVKRQRRLHSESRSDLICASTIVAGAKNRTDPRTCVPASVCRPDETAVGDRSARPWMEPHLRRKKRTYHPVRQTDGPTPGSCANARQKSLCSGCGGTDGSNPVPFSGGSHEPENSGRSLDLTGFKSSL